MNPLQPLNHDLQLLHVSTQLLCNLRLHILVTIQESLNQFAIHKSTRSLLSHIPDLRLETSELGERNMTRTLHHLRHLVLHANQQVLLALCDQREEIDRSLDSGEESSRNDRRVGRRRHIDPANAVDHFSEQNFRRHTKSSAILLAKSFDVVFENDEIALGIGFEVDVLVHIGHRCSPQRIEMASDFGQVVGPAGLAESMLHEGH